MMDISTLSFLTQVEFFKRFRELADELSSIVCWQTSSSKELKVINRKKKHSKKKHTTWQSHRKRKANSGN